MGILSDDMKRIVREQRLGFVATVGPDGMPNLSPKGTTTVLDEDHLVFADIRSPATLRNLRQNPALEINVVDPFARRGYRFRGRAIIVEPERDAAEFRRITEFYRTRWTDTGGRGAPFSARAFVVVLVEEALPLTSPSYDEGISEEELRAAWVEHYDKLNKG